MTNHQLNYTNDLYQTQIQDYKEDLSAMILKNKNTITKDYVQSKR